MIAIVRSASRFLAGLRWLFMPLGLFALVAVGVHAGADAVDDWLLAVFDWLDGRADRGLAAGLLALGELFGVGGGSIDRWVYRATSLVDLRERALLARWGAVALELWVDFVLAVPLLGYRERQPPEPGLEARVELLRAARGLAAPAREDARALLRAALRDPTLLRVALPLAAAATAVAGASRVASEVQASLFGALAAALPPEIAGPGARFAAIFVLGGVLVSLGGRAVAQAFCWAHRRAEEDRREGSSALRRRTRGLARAGVALPVALASLAAAPLLSFLR